MKNKYVVIGSGAMGTAAAKILFDAGHKNIVIYGIDTIEIDELKKGTNTKYFPNSIKLPDFNATTDLNEALEGATHVLLAIPSFAFDEILNQILALLKQEVLFINFSKGFYPDTFLSLHRGIEQRVGNNKRVRGVVSMVGPSHAEEIVQESPTIIACVTNDESLGKEVQASFSTKYFKTYLQKDVHGAEVGSTYKNILAIASGIAKGYGFGINTQAALLTRGLVEMQTLNKLQKGKAQTIYGLTGVGDLLVTATSPLSRNYNFGVDFAKRGEKALKTDKTVEGLYAIKIIYQIAKDKQIKLPIANALYQIIYQQKSIEKVFAKIWSSSLKEE